MHTQFGKSRFIKCNNILLSSVLF